MTHERRRLVALATVTFLGLLGAGCSGGSASDTSSSGGTNTTTAAAAARAKAVQFAQCMRDNGVAAFPDPDASGSLTLDGAVNGSSLDPNAPAWKQAITACKDLEPPGFTGHKRTAEQQKAALEFAACVRRNGIADFPDPTPDGPLIDTTRIPSMAGKVPRDDPRLRAALDACSATYAGRLGLTRR